MKLFQTLTGLARRLVRSKAFPPADLSLISSQRAPKEMPWSIEAEPHYGCSFNCWVCDSPSSTDPRDWKDMDPKHFETILRQMRAETSLGEKPIFIFAGRGNPLEHPDLARFPKAVRKVYPKAKTRLFWNGWGAESYKEFKRKAARFHEMLFSLDYAHLRGFRAALRARDASITPQRAEEMLTERLSWMLRLANEKEIKAQVYSLSRREKGESEWVERIVAKASRQAEVYNVQINYPKVALPGSKIGERLQGLTAYILHDGSVTQVLPRPEPTLVTEIRPKA